jgi:hypothetical protein
VSASLSWDDAYASVLDDPDIETNAASDGHRRSWDRPTGAGKARVSRNAYKGGKRAFLRELATLLRR